jgi:hypothetical protein
MLSLSKFSLLVGVFTVCAIGTGVVKKVNAATLPFNATFDLENTQNPIIGTTNPFTVSIHICGTGSSSNPPCGAGSINAPYGLTYDSGDIYGLETTSSGGSVADYVLNSDPSLFGLSGSSYPNTGIKLFGNSSNALYGVVSTTAHFVYDANGNGSGTSSGTFTIVSGTGDFVGASGTFSLNETDVYTNGNSYINSTVTYSGTINAPSVPEPPQVLGVGSVVVLVSLVKKRLKK